MQKSVDLRGRLCYHPVKGDVENVQNLYFR